MNLKKSASLMSCVESCFNCKFTPCHQTPLFTPSNLPLILLHHSFNYLRLLFTSLNPKCHNNQPTTSWGMPPTPNIWQDILHLLLSPSHLKARPYHLIQKVRLIILQQAEALTIICYCRNVMYLISLKVQPV